MLFVLEGIHGRVKAVVLVGHQLLFLDQAPERLKNQLLAFAHVFEDFLLEDEIAAVDAEFRIADGLDVADYAVGARGNHVIGEVWLRGDERGNLAVLLREIDEPRQL